MNQKYPYMGIPSLNYLKNIVNLQTKKFSKSISKKLKASRIKIAASQLIFLLRKLIFFTPLESPAFLTGFSAKKLIRDKTAGLEFPKLGVETAVFFN